MHVVQPAWLRHSGEQKDFEVYSYHVSPDGERLATGSGDGMSRVWSTETIFRANTTVPELVPHGSAFRTQHPPHAL